MNLEELQEAESYRDRISTVDDKGKRKWVFASKVKGEFYKWRNIVSYLYLAIFFILPAIRVNDMPWIMFNFPKSTFILFGKVFWPQDFFVFAIIMIAGIVFIALFTVIFGRLFCGWACPQTVFMEFFFRRIEWWIEGSPAEQRKLRDMPWNAKKIQKKLLKHSIYLLFSFAISHTFLAYIFGLKELGQMISEGPAEHGALIFGLVIFTLLFYAVFAYVRDLVCTVVCPYGRLQGVLFDKDTMQIAYDYNRGEERARINKKETTRTAGDCIDCHRCVQVCPTGIDIRDGLQMECVGCTACIDACDEVMVKVGFQKGLIRYASENEISGKRKFTFNNRMKGYTALLIGILAFITFLIATRKPVDVMISRVKGQLFQKVEGDSISNLFSAKVFNKTKFEQQFNLKLNDINGRIKFVTPNKLQIPEQKMQEVLFFVLIPNREITKRNTKIELDVYDNEGFVQTVKTTFLGPFK